MRTALLALAVLPAAFLPACRLPPAAPSPAPSSSTWRAGTARAGLADSAVTPEASCELALHAVLREAGTTRVAGSIQFRIAPAGDDSEAAVRYRGRLGPGDGGYSQLSVKLLPRVPDQAPAWTDVQKSDPGAPLSAILHFGRDALMSAALARALVDDPTRYKAVVNVESAAGGREAEGVVEAQRRVPESLRARQRQCFGG